MPIGMKATPIIKKVGRTVPAVKIGCQAGKRCCLKALSVKRCIKFSFNTYSIITRPKVKSYLKVFEKPMMIAYLLKDQALCMCVFFFFCQSRAILKDNKSRQRPRLMGVLGNHECKLV